MPNCPTRACGEERLRVGGILVLDLLATHRLGVVAVRPPVHVRVRKLALGLARDLELSGARNVARARPVALHAADGPNRLMADEPTNDLSSRIRIDEDVAVCVSGRTS